MRFFRQRLTLTKKMLCFALKFNTAQLLEFFMLYKVTIENFFSIANSQEISFKVPANSPCDLSCFINSRADKNIRLPTIVGFFGPNASGKSTVLRAIVNSLAFAIHSFDNGDQISSWFQPYRQKDWWDKPTKIAIEFDGQLKTGMPFTKFRYELHIAHQAQNFFNNIVLYEALSHAPQGKYRRLFEREEQKFYFGNEFGISSSSEKKNSIRANASILSTLAKLNHPESIHLNKLIGKWQSTIFGFGKIQPNDKQWLSMYAQDKECLNRLNQELRRFDIGLEAMSIEKGPDGLFAKLNHVGLDDCIYLNEESTGTQRFIEIFPYLHYALESGSIAVIDELDNDFHPLLIPELFNWFNDPKRNIHSAQLLFTANNPSILDVLEKEQIFFTEKPSGQSTHVYCARDIKGLRRDLSLVKKYLSGELGAVPHIG